MTAWVHHNLHTQRVSCRRQPPPGCSRRVDLTATWALVSDAQPHVSAAGLAALRRKGHRSVVADVRGEVTAHGDGALPFDLDDCRRVTFNPFRGDTFTYSDDGSEFVGCELLLVTGGYAYEVC